MSKWTRKNHKARGFRADKTADYLVCMYVASWYGELFREAKTLAFENTSLKKRIPDPKKLDTAEGIRLEWIIKHYQSRGYSENKTADFVEMLFLASCYTQLFDTALALAVENAFLKKQVQPPQKYNSKLQQYLKEM